MQDHELELLLTSEPPPLEPLPVGEYLVYGAGNIGLEVAAVLGKNGSSVRAFIDAAKVGKVAGLPVYAPGDETVRAFASEGLTVIIGIFNFTVDPWPVHTLLTEIGFRRIVTFNEFQELFELPAHYWLTGRTHAIQHRQRLRAGWNLLSDDTSRQIFLEAIRLRLTQDPRLMRQPTWGQQYLPDDLPRPRMPLRMIDGGAFTGDTLEFLLSKGATFEALAAFEPDPQNFAALQSTIQQLGSALGDAMVWPCGISDATGVANFRAGNGSGSAVADDGEIHVQLVALDQVLPSFAPNFIKLDIEGFELAALRGGAEMIRHHKPSLAVCVYHCPDHLWEIPLYLSELLPSHRIALRYHTYQAFELVAYAFPTD